MLSFILWVGPRGGEDMTKISQSGGTRTCRTRIGVTTRRRIHIHSCSHRAFEGVPWRRVIAGQLLGEESAQAAATVALSLSHTPPHALCPRGGRCRSERQAGRCRRCVSARDAGACRVSQPPRRAADAHMRVCSLAR